MSRAVHGRRRTRIRVMGGKLGRLPPPEGGWERIEAISRARLKAAARQRQEQARRTCELRLSEGRIRCGRVQLRLSPDVRTRRNAQGGYQCLPGQTIRFFVPEVIDAWDVFRDLYRFLHGWRPMRFRTEAQRAATRELFEQWDRLAAAVNDSRWS